MSSPMKDARWAKAKDIAGHIGLDFEHFTYEGWQILLNEAQEFLEERPEAVRYWANRFGGEDEGR